MDEREKAIESARRTNKALIDSVRASLPDLTAEQRVELFRLLSEGYCVECGEARGDICHCTNDE